MKKLPFKIKSNSVYSFTDQIVKGTIGAVRSGYYLPGDKLPTLLEISGQLGVSVMVVRNAFRQLASKGIVNVNRRLGIVVPDAPHGELQRHVIYISYGLGPSFYFAAITDSFVRTLNDNKCRVTTVLPSQLQTILDILDTQHVNMAVIDSLGHVPLSEIFKSREIPFVHAFPDMDGDTAHGAVASVVMDVAPAFKALAKHCQASGVREVCVCPSPQAHPYVRKLAEAMDGRGIRCSFIGTGAGDEPAGRLEGVNMMELRGYRSAKALLGSKERLPDMFLSMDDFFTRGMLVAFQDAGVDIPKDIQLVSLANRGNIPVWRTPISRIEHTPEKYGRLLAETCLRWFAKRRTYKPLLLRPKFIVGGTTWRNRRKRV